MDEISEFQSWYWSEFNEDPEHDVGLGINTICNPGWAVEICLKGTSLEDHSFIENEKGVGASAIAGDNDWYTCKVEDNLFIGIGGPFHLKTILRIFLDWKNGIIS
jgi:hypothetical protein